MGKPAVRLAWRRGTASRPTTMLLGVIADDFIGAGEIANTLAKGLSG